MATVLVTSEGKVTFLRVHERGTGFGPESDKIDVEVVARLDSVPDRGLGFQLRTDENQPVRQGMLGLLRDAFEHDFTARIDYDIDQDAGRNNGIIIRVALVKKADGTTPDRGDVVLR